MIYRARYCTLFALLVLGLLPASAQLTYRVFIKDLNPAHRNMSVRVFAPNYSYSTVTLSDGFGEAVLDSGRSIVIIGTNEVSMAPKELEILVPEQDGDTVYISTKVMKGFSTVPVGVYFYDTTSGTTVSSNDFDYRIVNADDPTISFSRNGPSRARFTFDSIPFGRYVIEPLFDTTAFLDPKNNFIVAASYLNPIIPFVIRPRCLPKFMAYTLTVEQGNWSSSVGNEISIASGKSIDDAGWIREMPFTFPSSPMTGRKVTIGSNGWLVLGWMDERFRGIKQPLSISLFAPVVVSVFSRDLNGRQTTNITESTWLRNGKQAYTVSWHDMSIFMPDFTESSVHLSGRVTIVESGEIGIEFGPMIAEDVLVEIGIRGSDRTDVQALFANDWRRPYLVNAPCLSYLSRDNAPEPGLQTWFTPLSTSIETEQPTGTGPEVFPCPASTYARIRGVANNSIEQLSVVTLYSSSGSMIDVSCKNDGEDLVLTLDGLASGAYRAVIEDRTFVFVVQH